MMERVRDKKSVSVQFVSDQDVEDAIIIGSKLKSRSKRLEKKTNNQKNGKIQNNYENEEIEKDVLLENSVYKPKALFQDGDVVGEQIFGFKTPNKKDGMALKAEECLKNSPRNISTPKHVSILKTPKTPKSKSKVAVVKEQINQEVTKTPYNLRRKIKKGIKTLVNELEYKSSSDSELDFSGSDSNYSESNEETSDSDIQSDTEKHVNLKKEASVILTPSGRILRKKKDLNYMFSADNYFSQSSTKSVTSNHTLGRLSIPRLSQDKLNKLLQHEKPAHESSISSLCMEHQSMFSKWNFILSENFNILLYGVGSKRDLLHRYHKMYLSDSPVLIINGFFPSLTMAEIFVSIAEDILELENCPSGIHEAVDFIEDALLTFPDQKINLIIHNLDGIILRNVKYQEALSRLAKLSNIKLLASIDHINTALLWNQAGLGNFNFNWWDVTSLLPYTIETAFESSLMVQQSGSLALSSLSNVFKSLTSNAKGIFKIIVEHQLENSNNPQYAGMAFSKLYSASRENFLASSDQALRAQLREFIDHRLIKDKRGIDGSELLLVPIENSILKQFLNNCY